MRLIDADALKESLKQSKEACNTWYDNCDSDMKPRVEQALITFIECIIRVNDMPTVEERKKGKWLRSGSELFPYECDQCGDTNERKTPYCPHCCADMREKT